MPKKIIVFGIRFGGVVAMLSAGSVHSFPPLWRRWEVMLTQDPWAHWFIGSVALSFGILNGILFASELLGKYKKSPPPPQPNTL